MTKIEEVLDFEQIPNCDELFKGLLQKDNEARAGEGRASWADWGLRDNSERQKLAGTRQDFTYQAVTFLGIFTANYSTATCLLIFKLGKKS